MLVKKNIISFVLFRIFLRFASHTRTESMIDHADAAKDGDQSPKQRSNKNIQNRRTSIGQQIDAPRHKHTSDNNEHMPEDNGYFPALIERRKYKRNAYEQRKKSRPFPDKDQHI